MNNVTFRAVKGVCFTLISILCFIFLFIGGPNYYSGRVFTQAWSLGHIFAFCLWTYILTVNWKYLANETYIKQCLIIFCLVFFVGSLIEIIQIKFNRTACIADVIRDLKGSALSIAFLAPARRTISKAILRFAQLSVVLIIIFEIYPLAITISDEVISKLQFPLIAGFETPFETSRLSNSKLKRDGSVAIEGKYSLKVPLTKKKYSGVGFKYFPKNWKGYNYFHMSIYQTSANNINVTLKIYDLIHAKTGRNYNDRYSKNIELKRGWNNIQVPLQEIVNAPIDRTMDLNHIHAFGVHAIDPSGKDVIYIDDVCLLKQSGTDE
ncbi:MAG: hypothetical protein KJ737_15800 [Proteobacteria bacterium]|nr:hypothetical protein [Pseudomonadota bacterium]